jgi:RNA polymerase sigma-70 factor, ECF subfamily
VTGPRDQDAPSSERPALTDRRLLAGLVPGSRADFEFLYRFTYPRVFATCLAVLGGDPPAAEDCAQDTFVRAFRSWASWRGDAPADLWLQRIAVNVARSHRRRRHRRDLPLLLDVAASSEAPDEEIALWQALGRIPIAEAAAFVLRFHHGYSGEEIAAAFGVSVRTAFGRIAKARGRLRQMLDPRPSSPPAGPRGEQRRLGSRV